MSLCLGLWSCFYWSKDPSGEGRTNPSGTGEDLERDQWGSVEESGDTQQGKGGRALAQDGESGVIIAVWEAKIRLAEDLDNASSWDVDGLREALANLTGKPATTTHDPVLQLTGGGEKKGMTDEQAKL